MSSICSIIFSIKIRAWCN